MPTNICQSIETTSEYFLSFAFTYMQTCLKSISLVESVVLPSRPCSRAPPEQTTQVPTAEALNHF